MKAPTERAVRRALVLLALLALAGLAALVTSAATFADSPGGRTAFALVDPNGGTPRLVAAQTSGFVGVSSPFAGDYCLTPARRCLPGSVVLGRCRRGDRSLRARPPELRCR